MNRLWAFWQKYLTEPWPAQRLAAARIAFVGALFYRFSTEHYAYYARQPAEFYTPEGPWRWLALAPPTERELSLGWLLLMVFLVCGAIGLGTRKSLLGSVVVLLFLEGAQNSFGKVDHGTIMVLWALLLLGLARSGDAWSVDALLARFRRRPEASRETYALAPPGRYTWPIRLYLIHLGFFYFFAGWSKLAYSGWAWANGEALRSYLLYRSEPVGLWIAESLPLCAALSVGTLLLELTFPIGVLFRRLRPLYLLGGLSFHIGTELMMGIFFTTFYTYLLFPDWPKGFLFLKRLFPQKP